MVSVGVDSLVPLYSPARFRTAAAGADHGLCIPTACTHESCTYAKGPGASIHHDLDTIFGRSAGLLVGLEYAYSSIGHYYWFLVYFSATFLLLP